jgi:uncharacterized protein (TIGR02246 family)
MPTDEQQIRTLVERWANAVHEGDLTGVLIDHADDIVMFDVPPPQQGVRGLDAYKRTWPDFFEWQAQGAVFEIVELDVHAGNDVAYAHALLRCGMPADIGDQRLRLTLGLKKQDGRWTVTHEHHSFPDETPDTAGDEHALRAIHAGWFADAATAVQPVEHLGPLAPIIGRWRTSGSVLDEKGGVIMTIAGTDTYTWLPGGHWIVHEADVTIGDQRRQILELIGGRDERSGGWQMHAFDTDDSPGFMRLSIVEPGLLLLEGDGVRSWFRPQAGPTYMTTLWEREIEQTWIAWMDMRFDHD